MYEAPRASTPSQIACDFKKKVGFSELPELSAAIGNPRLADFREINAACAAPELLQRVVVSRLLVEQVNHDVAVVLKDPRSRGVTFHAQSALAELLDQRAIDFFRYRVQLAAARACHHQKIVEDGSHF